ncbi:hypothetical protein D3H65_20940 [Paraflavitalea soli]|uniref:Uncharacterized protein n=1 Tax=Paraflavitalea soli TaxID=2315862 RepID=A0A3B7MQ92_9BACT|nr:hypothetical protein D3H65_20940 [Paraflavitalea soli]
MLTVTQAPAYMPELFLCAYPSPRRKTDIRGLATCPTGHAFNPASLGIVLNGDSIDSNILLFGSSLLPRGPRSQRGGIEEDPGKQREERMKNV